MKDDLGLDRYRSYLVLLARSAVGPRWARKFDPSDIVQETLLDGHRKRADLRGQTTAEVAAWLRTILCRNLARARRDLRRAKRDLQREVPLEAALDRSSARLHSLLPAGDSSPSGKAQRAEEALRLSRWLLELAESQREAVTLTYLAGLSLEEAGAQLGRTPVAVASLVRRGLARLRELARAADGREMRRITSSSRSRRSS